MSDWDKINQLFDDAKKIEQLQSLYMERGNVSPAQAREWALTKWKDAAPPPESAPSHNKGETK